MSKSLRLSERWFRIGLWVVAVVFAGFLIGLGSTVVENLPHVEQRLEMQQFMQQERSEELRTQLQQIAEQQREADDELDQARLKHDVLRSNVQSARETFNNWLATRGATHQSGQDAELIARTRELDELKAGEQQALRIIQDQQQILLDLRQHKNRLETEQHELEQEAREAYRSALRKQELRIFAYRLLLTLPLLAVAGWLFVKQRKGSWWPFVWGFVFFALFTFFVELVPYIPSYGGWVRYTVGIIITLVTGRYAILALQRYLERQRQAEALPDVERRRELSYDRALALLAKKVCPGCERPVDLEHGKLDYCPHCGICLFDYCGSCQSRRSAFARFCHVCGTAAGKV